MPRRTIPFANDEYYHVYNRGVAHQPTYLSVKTYERFLLSLSYYRFNNTPFKLSRLLQIAKTERESVLINLVKSKDKIVELIGFCLMPNHFHILIQQKTYGGISKFLKQVTDSYTRYFNTKHERVGPVFQGAFKAVHVTTDEQLLHLSRYIHLNPLVSYVVQKDQLFDYRWSSLSAYLKDDRGLVNPEVILQQFKSPQSYLKFVMDQADFGKKLERIKHLTLE